MRSEFEGADNARTGIRWISGKYISEAFTLLKRNGEWLITQKTFDWHES